MSNVEMAAVENICWTSSPNLADTQDVSLRTSTDGFDNTLEESIAFNGNDADIQDMIDSFLHTIKECGVLCPIMGMRAPFSSDFVVKKQEHLLLDLTSDEAECELSVIRLYLTALFEPAYKSLPLDELRAIANDFSLTYTRNEIDFIEQTSRDQSSSKLWFRVRAGRVTGSVFKSIDEDTYNIDTKHEYYYQVQMEIFLADAEYCDFIVWSPKTLICIRVYKDNVFWEAEIEKAAQFFV
ncbi:hypothetical protein Bhyg_03222, partial [Pseudolycoriella hygida]